MGPVFAAPKALASRRPPASPTWTSSTCTRPSRRRSRRNPQALRLQEVRRGAASVAAQAVGEIDPAKLNVNGGSIAIGHPFAATGARMVLSTLRELKKRGSSTALLTVCAAGGLGAAVVLEAT